MLQTITQALQSGSSGFVALPLALALGLVSALASACCTLPAMGMLVAYSGARAEGDKRAQFSSAVWFLIGTTLALTLMGLVAGMVGQAVQVFLGNYWKIFAGIVAVFIGLATLKLLPLPSFGGKQTANKPTAPKTGLQNALGGLFLGGGLAACSLPCNPGIFIILGAAVLQGKLLWGTLLMLSFAIGFSLPLSAIVFGVSLGATSIKAGKADSLIRNVAGVALVISGLYLLATF